ncbi:hypothetical protein GCM10009865_51820 [Aeromicrobium ponti]|uniref:Uncharacterized protein n=2 Tax=Cytobacillus oceanisediminis TaxID=665099 RepID=A0A562J746_9BACI|nr:hypothetical protein IQ19_05102 [Cytobacillus oceanisediminis]
MSNEWQQEPWQPQNKKVFPAVIVITDTRYKIESPYIKFYQVPHIDLLVNRFEPKKTDIQIKNSTLKLKNA